MAHLSSGRASFRSAPYPLSGLAELITYIRCAAPLPAVK